MATSGSIDFTVTRDDIIKAAYRHVLADEDFTLTTNQTTNASLLLNSIVKSWNVMLHVPIWSIAYGYILPTSNATSLVVPGTTNVVSGFNSTVLASSALSGASTITLAVSPGNINGYAIGIELDSGDMFWTTVNGVPVGAVITLTSPLTGNASSNNYVYFYATTARIQKPVRVVSAYRNDISAYTNGFVTSVSTIPIKLVTSTEFLDETTNFFSKGSPIKLAYEPGVSTSFLRFWPRFPTGKSYIQFRYSRILEDFDSGSDNPDFPQEWYLPLVYELAVALAPTYNVGVEKFQILKSEARRWFDKVSENDYEEGSIKFYPQIRNEYV